MNKVTIKSSKGFYIGDICYVLNKDFYHGVWGAADYKDGKYADPKTGAEFAVAGTAYGDGEYQDNHGNRYPVDAGVIGLVPLELVEEEGYTDLGHIEEMPGEATFEAHDGRFTVTLPDDKVILIDTTDDGAEDEDDDDDYWGDDEAQDDYETMDPEDFLDKYL